MIRVVMAIALLAWSPVVLAAQPELPGVRLENGQDARAPAEGPMSPMQELNRAVIALPLAAVLGAALAFRPKRRGTPERTPAVIQTQIILALVGSVIMLIVGASVARAFAIVGAASLIRYRSKIEDPKDAGVMLSALAVGLATGVGLYALAGFSTAFIILVVSIIESLEPKKQKMFELTVKTKDATALRAQVEALLKRQQVRYELRTSSHEELSYAVTLPFDRKTDRLSNALLELDPSGETSVDWSEKARKGK
jgi:uncharacterized membrane protein YhiD involved in acid resistance